MINNNTFTCGPFLSSSLNVEKFSQNVYYNYLLASSLETYVEYENKLQAAIEQEMSEEYIANLQKESQYFSGLLDLALSVGTNADNEEIQ
jgi:uncharacterized protein (DUF488 family)